MSERTPVWLRGGPAGPGRRSHSVGVIELNGLYYAVRFGDEASWFRLADAATVPVDLALEYEGRVYDYYGARTPPELA